MRNFKLLMVWVLFGAVLTNCDLPSTPKNPNFTTSHKVEAPLLFEKTFQFLGGGEGATEALLDTTKGDFDSLFVVTQGGVNDGLISISVEEEFEFGDLNDAIPTIGIDPTSFSSAVGEITLGSFSSPGSGDLGRAGFQDLTGLNPAFVPAGTPIPAGSTPTPVTIDVGQNTDFFESATIKRGALEISITNDLGFDISSIEVILKSGNNIVTSTTLNNVNQGVTTTGQLVFSEGDILGDINVEIDVNWDAQNTSAEPNELIIEELNGIDLVASSVRAAVTEIDIETSNSTTFDAVEFQFSTPEHYVELATGEIALAPIVNGLDLTLESLVISFPGIRSAPYGVADSLVISYTGDDKILRSETSVAQNIDLAGYRIYAPGNTINFSIAARTENTQNSADPIREIAEDNVISSSVAINNLSIATAFGEIASQVTLLGEDDASNGTDIVDLYNETEVSLTSIDGIEDLSSEIDGIEFAGASLSITYTSNIGIPTTIYMAILGIDGDDQELYLGGTSGTEREVQAGDPITGLVANGVQLTPSQLIKFTLDPSPDGNPIQSAIVFDQTNTNVTDFLNALPKEIRFIGKAVVNETGGEATISTPLEFDPGMVVDLPVFFSADGASLEFTEDGSSLEDLPGEGDDARLTQGELIVSYQNGLPLGFDITLDFLDAAGGTITSVPLAGELPVELRAASVDAVSRFASGTTTDNLIISLNESQLMTISATDSIAVSAALNTFATEAVKVKGTDTITLSVSASFTIETDIKD